MYFYRSLIIVLVLFILLLTKTGVFAQSGGRSFLNGKVVDEKGLVIPYASVALFNAADASLTGGAATDENGEFRLAVEEGDYYLEISFLSYKKKVVKDISPGNKNLNLGTITLSPSALSLEGVTVQAEKSEMQLQLDKRVFNVGKDLSNTGSNASEILDNVPSVSVDVDGNVSLRGSENVRILIDGKPSGLTGSSTTDALRQLPGALIESVEVITNPSARYDAEGEVGIINIILKKERREGVNGSFDVAVGYPHNHNAAFNLNYRKKWINLFTSYGVNYRKTPGLGRVFQEFTEPDTIYTYSSEREHTRGGLSNNLRLGSDFYLNDKNILTVSGLYSYSNGLNDATVTYQDFDENDILSKTTIRQDDEREVENEIETSLSYQKLFKKEKQKLTFDVKWMLSDDTETSDITEQVDDSNSLTRQRSSNTEDQINWLFQTDYVHPFSKEGRFETGLKATLREIENDYKAEEQATDGNWFTVPGYDNFFIYTENIYAAYVMAGNKSGHFSYQAGLRGELSDITTELVETSELYHRNYFNLFPSAHLSYEINKQNSLQLSYSYRLSRPGFRHLLPFYSFSDNRNFRGGNPNLDPEYTHSFELGHLKYWEKGSLLSSIYYRYRTGVIERITVIDSIGFTRLIPVNLSEQNAFGIELSFSYDLLSWWRVNIGGNFYRAYTSGSYEGQDLYSDTYSGNLSAGTKITIFKKLNFQTNLDYEAPQNTTQGKVRARYTIDTGLSMDVLKGNGTLTLTGKDLLNTRKRQMTTYGENFYSEYEFQWRSRQVLLSFNYRLNQSQKKNNAAKMNSGGNGGGDDF